MDSVDAGRTEVPISALAQYGYCPRRCGLIHVEQTFDDNVFTVRGHLAHERVDAGERSFARNVRIERDVQVWSDALGIRGKADLVEFRASGPFPVEYKVGVPRGEWARLQVCAQALCLEEMTGEPVPRGAIYSHALRTREEISFDRALRQRTSEAIESVRAIMESQQLPEAPNDQRCGACSLQNACLPEAVGERPRMRGLQGALFRPLDEGTDPW